MSMRAIITVAAMREAIQAAKEGLKVEVKPDGTLIIAPAAFERDAGDEFDLVSMKR